MNKELNINCTNLIKQRRATKEGNLYMSNASQKINYDGDTFFNCRIKGFITDARMDEIGKKFKGMGLRLDAITYRDIVISLVASKNTPDVKTFLNKVQTRLTHFNDTKYESLNW